MVNHTRTNSLFSQVSLRSPSLSLSLPLYLFFFFHFFLGVSNRNPHNVSRVWGRDSPVFTDENVMDESAEEEKFERRREKITAGILEHVVEIKRFIEALLYKW